MIDVSYSEGPPRRYTVNGEVVPSVTKILGCLDKPGLPWWGMTTGVDGVLELVDRYGWRDAGLPADLSGPQVVKWLTSEKLTVNHVRDTAATRGKSVHDALELYATTGEVPDLSRFPSEDRGYVQALTGWLLDADPEFEATEVMVGSAAHSYAGRFDFIATVDGERGLWDAKTSKKVYDTHLLQLEAYEGAHVEMGEDSTDARYVLRLGADGEYEVVKSYATFDDFLGVKAAFDAMERVKAAKPRKRRKKAVA